MLIVWFSCPLSNWFLLGFKIECLFEFSVRGKVAFIYGDSTRPVWERESFISSFAYTSATGRHEKAQLQGYFCCHHYVQP